MEQNVGVILPDCESCTLEDGNEAYDILHSSTAKNSNQNSQTEPAQIYDKADNGKKIKPLTFSGNWYTDFLEMDFTADKTTSLDTSFLGIT
mmetsp:Transcript_8840/g.13620  ORF Transcript_8840/g.13620 Transcript_8840/m.13620 type:complete len:91 (-) Transcript_8840:1064-1336(-)